MRLALFMLPLFLAPAFAADPAPTVTHQFKITTESVMQMEGEGLPASITLNNDIRYSWKQSGRERTLQLHDLGTQAKTGRVQIRDITMSRAGVFGTEQGKKMERKYDDAPETLQRALRDTFDTPLCKLEMDENGKETKRTIIAGAGALKADKWMNFVTSVGHPSYSADKKEWRATAVINAGQNDASGELTYTKGEEGKTGQKVKVTGVLRPVVAKAENGLAVSDGKYTVEGTQTYDPKLKEWISGTLNIDVEITLSKENKKVGTAKGKMKLTFELLPEKNK